MYSVMSYLCLQIDDQIQDEVLYLAHQYAMKENSILDYDSFHKNNDIVCVIIHEAHNRNVLKLFFCIATLTTRLRLWNSNSNKVKSHCHDQLQAVYDRQWTIYCGILLWTLSWSRCHLMCCCWAIVTYVSHKTVFMSVWEMYHVFQCVLKMAFEFFRPLVPDIDLWQLSKAITLSDSKHYRHYHH